MDRTADLDAQVIIFDTLTRCFRFDNDDSHAGVGGNDFLTNYGAKAMAS